MKLILQPGLFAFYSAELLADWHSHSAIQLVWPEASGGWEYGGPPALHGSLPLLVGSGVRHALQAKQCWVILLERHSKAGKAAAGILAERPELALDASPLGTAIHTNERTPWLNRVADLLGVDESAFNPQPSDPRLRKLISQLDRCFDRSCVKPSQWRASEVAAGLALSESRFLHLFRQQMQIPWRPYLLWRRLLCAVRALREGKSATVSALEAGFSDSAHFSRTFRAYFGMSVREALTMAR